MDRLVRDAESIWGRLKGGKYIDLKKISGVTQSEIAKQINRQLRELPSPPGKSGNPDVLAANDFGNIVAEFDDVKKEVVNQNVQFIQFERKGQIRYAVIQKQGDRIDHRRKPPLFLASSNKPQGVIDELKSEGYGFVKQQEFQVRERRPSNTRYPRKFIEKYGRDFYRNRR